MLSIPFHQMQHPAKAGPTPPKLPPPAHIRLAPTCSKAPSVLGVQRTIGKILGRVRSPALPYRPKFAPKAFVPPPGKSGLPLMPFAEQSREQGVSGEPASSQQGVPLIPEALQHLPAIWSAVQYLFLASPSDETRLTQQELQVRLLCFAHHLDEASEVLRSMAATIGADDAQPGVYIVD